MAIPKFSLVENGFRLRQTARVKRTNFFALLLGAALLAGCKPAAQTQTPSPDDALPTNAQPKLPTITIYFGVLHDNQFRPIKKIDAEQALTPRQQMTGMMFRTNIQDTDAMLFPLPYTQRANFWMMNCPESISAAYITPEGVIAEIHHLEKNDTNGVAAATDNIRFVLETSDGWFARHNVGTGAVARTEKGSLMETFFPNQ
jgi:uncharacterized membrane protein (UPF0127 family)